jgi:cytochrome c
MSKNHKKPNLESNKIFAAVLVAAIVAMFSGFIAKRLVPQHDLEKSVLEIDTSAFESAQNAGAGPAAAAVPEPILGLIATADLTLGEKTAKLCAACHSFDKGGANKVGPNMWNAVGGVKGHMSGFAYSDVIQKWHAEGKKWDYEALNHFLWKPKAYAAGTKMSFVGIKKPEERAAVIAWLRTMADTPLALPDQGAIDAEKAAYDAATGVKPAEADAGAQEPAPSATAVPTDGNQGPAAVE